jgi:hypothetical protein
VINWAGETQPISEGDLMSLDIYREEMAHIQKQIEEVDNDPTMSSASKKWTKLQLERALMNLKRAIEESE